jgi:uncharacterized protein YsxB (DUF464 family)
MIVCRISQNSISVQGHANYAEYGKDIVCSAVTILYETLLMVFDNNKIQYSVDNQVITFDKGGDYLQFFIAGIEILEKHYPEYVRTIKDYKL